MILSVSIDLDPLWCYRRIYGLPPKDGPDPVTRIATERFCALCDELEIPGTLFVVGKTLEDPGAVEALREAKSLGHEIANHSFSHRYDLSKLGPSEIKDEVEGGARAIEKALGDRPTGFRAPGYILGQNILPAVLESGALYDSSILPSPAYQGLKAAAMGFLQVKGSPSGAILGDPREALAPNRPYHPDLNFPWRKKPDGLVELPISSLMGVPLTGAILALCGPSRVHWLSVLAQRVQFVCLELHGVDLMDITADNLDPDLGVQRDLTVAFHRKADAIRVLIEKIQSSHQVLTLSQASQEIEI